MIVKIEINIENIVIQVNFLADILQIILQETQIIINVILINLYLKKINLEKENIKIKKMC